MIWFAVVGGLVLVVIWQYVNTVSLRAELKQIKRLYSITSADYKTSHSLSVALANHQINAIQQNIAQIEPDSPLGKLSMVLSAAASKVVDHSLLGEASVHEALDHYFKEIAMPMLTKNETIQLINNNAALATHWHKNTVAAYFDLCRVLIRQLTEGPNAK